MRSGVAGISPRRYRDRDGPEILRYVLNRRATQDNDGPAVQPSNGTSEALPESSEAYQLV